MSNPAVGTLREGPLHASLKRWCAMDGDTVEQPVDGYVIDLVRGPELIEIQTRGFSAMRRKLDALLDDHPVRIVHPVATERWIVKMGDGGEVLSRRRSPKHGTAVDVCHELVSFPGLVAHPNLTIDVLLTHEEELRRFDGRRGRRRKGWVVVERRLLEVVDRAVVSSPADLADLLPPGLPAAFTTADLAKALGRPRRLAQEVAYCLREVGALERTARTQAGHVYRLATRTRG